MTGHFNLAIAIELGKSERQTIKYSYNLHVKKSAMYAYVLRSLSALQEIFFLIYLLCINLVIC